MSMWGGNKLKETLEDGKLAVGSCVYSSSPSLVELMGRRGWTSQGSTIVTHRRALENWEPERGGTCEEPDPRARGLIFITSAPISARIIDV